MDFLLAGLLLVVIVALLLLLAQARRGKHPADPGAR